jgi:predicted RNase H-like HicB family nuclease
MSVVTVNSEPSKDEISGISFKAPKISNTTIKTSYRIILQKDEDGRIVVRCPDLQGVVTDGADINEAERNAVEAIDAVLESRGLNKEYNLIVIHKPSD